MKVFSIAELGVNHLGQFDKALNMICKAKAAGATAVKLQKYNPVKVLGRNHPALNDAHQFSWAQLKELSNASHRLGLLFGISVFDVNDVPIVTPLVDFQKIASRMNQNQEFIAKIEHTKLPTYMSVQPVTTSQRIPDRFKLMWCVREYPTTKEEVLKYPYEHIGLSSHCPDPSATLEAVKRGATVIENHVKESNDDMGCDMSSSLTFEQYGGLINDIAALGSTRR